MWEIPALAIINELRSRAVLKSLGKFELQILYARAMTRVWEKSRFSRRWGRSMWRTSALAAAMASCGRTGACRR